MDNLHKNRIMLLGDCLVTLSFLSYLGAFSFDFRQSLIVDKWQKDLLERSIPRNDPINLQVLLTNEVEIIKWASEGLPSEDLVGRIKSFNNSDFLQHLEMSVNFGFPFLFENLDEYVDPVINPVLEKSLTIQGPRRD